jgi:poly(3-hydroxybutyrate) depolymerase
LGWDGFIQDHILVAPTGYMNCWNISDEPSEAPDVEMVGDLVEQLQTYDNVNPNQIRIIGSSNGSALANRVFIENNNPGIDIVCAIVSQLSEAQYHDSNFYYPSGNTGGNQEFDGYDIMTIPIEGRKYLNIGNTNDQLIPYYGGPAVGVNFINSLDAIFIIANSQGYQGNQLSDEGEQIGSSSVYKYPYLLNQVVHLKGDAGHGINATQREYIIDFLSQGSLGDINGDNMINILDVVATVNLALNNGYDSMVDINLDGVINILDIVQLVDIILN